MLCWGISRNWLAPWVPSCPLFFIGYCRSWILGCLRSWIDSLCSCCGHGFFLDYGRTWIPLWNGCWNGSSMELVPIMDFFRCFWSVLLLYRMKTINFVVAADLRGIPGKTVHNQLLCVVQHLNAPSNDMKFSTFSELILLIYFYKRSDVTRLFLQRKLYCLFTSTREVILLMLLQEGLYCLVLLQERFLST